jgi:predicted RNA binding protein YcfA (HicA-like mRNA interferase family)
MKYNALFKLLKKHGWHEVRQKGSHVILQHSEKKGRITVPYHASKEVKRAY